MRFLLSLLLIVSSFTFEICGQNWSYEKEMYNRQQFDSAINYLKSFTVSRTSEEKAQAFFEMGFIYLAGKKDISSASSAFENAGKLSNYNPATRAALSIIYQFNEKWSQIVEILEPIKYETDFTKGAPPDGASAKFPPRQLVIKTYIYGLANMDQYDKADVYSNKLYLSDASLIIIFELKGDMYMSRSKWTNASQAYSTYVSEYEKNLTNYSLQQRARFKPSLQLFDRWQEALQKAGDKSGLTVVANKRKVYYP